MASGGINRVNSVVGPQRILELLAGKRVAFDEHARRSDMANAPGTQANTVLSAWLPLPWPNGNVGGVNTGMASCRGQIGDPVTG
jgi:hypothetical protein